MLARVGAADRPGNAGAAPRGQSEGDALLRVLVDLQRSMSAEIILVPETLVWTSRPEREGFSLVDTVFGSADFPGELRAAGQLLFNHKNTVIRAGEPVSLRDFLAQDGGHDAGSPPCPPPRALATTRRRRGGSASRCSARWSASGAPCSARRRSPPTACGRRCCKSPKLQAVLRDLAGPGPEGPGAARGQGAGDAAPAR